MKVLSANGMAFAGKRRGRMVQLERHLAGLGSATGTVAYSGCSIVIGRRRAGQTATVYRQGDRVMINDTVARRLTLDRSARHQPLNTQKLSARS